MEGFFNMGAWRYCSCGNSLPYPQSAYEDLTDFERICVHCGEDNGPSFSVEEWIIKLDERLSEIETLLKKLVKD